MNITISELVAPADTETDQFPLSSVKTIDGFPDESIIVIGTPATKLGSPTPCSPSQFLSMKTCPFKVPIFSMLGSL